MAWTNISKQKMFEATFEGSSLSLPDYFCLQLGTSTTGSYTANLENTSAITTVSDGNGYDSSGLKVERNGVDLVVTSYDSGTSSIRATLKSGYEWTAQGGTIAGITHVLLTAGSVNGSPVAYNQRTIWAYWSLGQEFNIPSGSKFIINSGILQGT